MCRFWTQFLCEKKALQASHHQAKKKEKFFLSRKLQTKQLEEKKTAAYIIDIYCVEREAHFRGSHVTGVYKLDRKYHAHAKNKRSKNRNKNMQTSLKLLTAVYRVNTISFFPPNNRKSRTAKSTSLHQSRHLPYINKKTNTTEHNVRKKSSVIVSRTKQKNKSIIFFDRLKIVTSVLNLVCNANLKLGWENKNTESESRESPLKLICTTSEQLTKALIKICTVLCCVHWRTAVLLFASEMSSKFCLVHTFTE